MYHSRKKGFTMVELVIVIAVIAILAAILIPTFTNLIRKANEASALANARNAANQLLANLLARGDDAKDLVIFNQKGDDIYVYGYSAEAGRVLAYYGNPVDAESIDGETLEDKAKKLLEKMLANGELTLRTPRPTETDWWHPSKMEEVVTGLNFKPEEMVLRADYKIVLARFEKGGQPEHTCTAADLDEIAEVPATCSTNGYPAYWVCRVCGRAYHNADATRPVSADDPLEPTDIDPNAHQLGAWQHDESKHWQVCALNPGHTHLNEAAHTGNPCTVCGYSTGGNTPTSPAGKKNGLVDGIYYKDDEPLTGTDKGYTFRDGHLVLTGTKGTPTNSGSAMDQKLTFNIPTDEAFLTNKVILIFDDCNDYLMPGAFGGNEIQVTNASNYATVSIKAEGLDNLKAAINALRNAVNSGDTSTILETIKTQYGIDESCYPQMVPSDDFKAYWLGTFGENLQSSGTLADADYQKYLDAIASGNTYVSYLKNKYGVSRLSNLPWGARVNYYDSFAGKWPSTNTAESHGIFDGNCLGHRMVEPEFILLALEHYYNQVAFVGVSNNDPSSLINASQSPSPTNRFYKYDTEDWKSGVSTEYGVKLYSHIQASEGQILNVTNTNQFFVFTIQHGYLMSNVWQVFGAPSPTFEIVLERTN